MASPVATSASPSLEMLAAHDAIAISVRNHQDDDDHTRALSGDPPTDHVRDASPTTAPVHLLSPRLMRALRQLMNHPSVSDSSEDSLHTDSEADAASVTMVAPVLCQICLDEVEMDETVQLRACGHRFCTACFTRFLTLKISEGQVHLTCFFEHPPDVHAARVATASNVCGVAIERSDIQRLVPPAVFAKFEKFQFNQAHSFARQCPHCDYSVLCEGPEKPQCVCEMCDRPFCFTHGSAHDATMSCDEYDKRQLRADKRNRRKIKRISKPCPTCQSPVEKNGGCNHMRCVSCSTDFCWLCGQKVSELISDHYDWTNIRGCAGQQMVHIHGLTTTNKCLLYAAKLALYIIVYPIALVLTLLLMVLSCFFALCMVNQDLSFVQVFRWAFRIIAIAGYTAVEFLAVTIVTGFAAGIFGICWGFHELYKLGKRSVQHCVALRRKQCPIRCACPCGSRSKTQQVEVVTTPQVLECSYSQA